MKTIEVAVVPRVGEFVKFTIEGEDDYVPWQVSEVTHRESGSIEVSTELLEDVDGRGYSFDDEVDFDLTITEYQNSGWVAPGGVRPNKKKKEASGDAEPTDSTDRRDRTAVGNRASSPKRR